MKLTKFNNLLLVGLVLTIAVVGCRKRPIGVTNLPNGGMTKPAVSTGGAGGGGEGGNIGDGVITGGPAVTGWDIEKGGGIPLGPGHDGWATDTVALKANTVHFAFDSSVVRTEEKPRVAAVAEYLKSNPANAVKIEGHCDERGTEEYNRALGDRRAQALREALVQLGIEPTRVDTISYGKDRPLDHGHDDAAWRQNRRGEFIVLIPPTR